VRGTFDQHPTFASCDIHDVQRVVIPTGLAIDDALAVRRPAGKAIVRLAIRKNLQILAIAAHRDDVGLRRPFDALEELAERERNPIALT